MKNFLLTLSFGLVMLSNACAQTPGGKADKNAPEITFESTEHDFGTLPYEGNGTTDFVFTNSGKEPLVLTNVQSSCGCTTPEWPREPIKNGQKATIRVKYDTKRAGSFTKSITVTSNAATSPVVLTIKGVVTSPAPATAQ
jgi:hypothetical protein